MNITVIFSDCGDELPPEGTILTFRDVGDLQVDAPADVKDISCAEAGCRGCSATHRTFTGTSHLRLEASGARVNGPRWVVPAVVN